MNTEETYKEILRKLRLLDNGPAADSMAEHGADYRKMRGASTVQLKKMAQAYAPNQSLAERLWKKDSRETRLLALMVANPSEILEETANKWVYDFSAGEMAEQACMHLLPETNFAARRAIKWAASANEFVCQTGCVLVARLVQLDKNINENYISDFLVLSKNLANTPSVHVRKALARALRAIGSKSLKYNDMVNEVVASIKTIDSDTARWIAEDVAFELEFRRDQLQKNK